jgi:hypothetical protein
VADAGRCLTTRGKGAIYVNVNHINMGPAMEIAARLDEIGKPVWIALMIVGFALYWPIGLAILAYLIWSGRMGCWKHGHRRRWRDDGGDWMQEKMRRWSGGEQRAASGNRAFDDYREATLRRLEDEQREFVTFLEQLRLAKDKAEFDEFLNQRRRRPETPEPQAPG